MTFALQRGLAFALRRAFAFALRRGLAFALRRGLAFALLRALAFALRRALAFALQRGLAVALRRALAFALRRASTFALRRALAFPLYRAFAFGVGHVFQVEARRPGFEKAHRQKEDKNGNMVLIAECVAEIEVWHNYHLTDGDLIHGCHMDRRDLGDDIAPAPDFIGKVHGDGPSGDMVTIVCSNKPPIVPKHKYWCCLLPDEAAFRSLREAIRTGKAWNALLNATRQESHVAASLPAEDSQILRHLVAHHNLNPSQALAVRQCLDEGTIVSSMTRGAVTGKSETLVACIKAAMWQHGHFDPCTSNPKKPDLVHTGKKGGWGGT